MSGFESSCLLTLFSDLVLNPNIELSKIFVQGLAESGLTDVVICPGSRSTPLTLVFDAHPDIQTHLCLDERSGAFFALGMAQATTRPVAIVCTSGTAAANFYPAVIEANMSQVPLLVLTADRPPELRHSGANQTIDQVKMFGDHVLWAVDMPLPDELMPEVAWRNVATTAGRAYAKADGLRKGVVHCNFPFRKPLQPEADSWSVGPLVSESASNRSTGLPTNRIPKSICNLQPAQEHQLADWFARYERGIIVCGPNCPEGEFGRAVEAFAEQAGFPIFADPISGIRFGAGGRNLVVGGYETWLAGGREPDFAPPKIVIRFGAVPTSKWLNAYLGKIEPEVRLHVRESAVWADDGHMTTDFWQVNETIFCNRATTLAPSRNRDWLAQVQGWEAAGWDAVAREMETAEFDAAFVWDMVENLPECNLMIGNSLPVRHLDAFGKPSSQKVRVFGNRGASGIDGVVSTACGIAAAEPEKSTLLIIGDVSFYHDMNGLLAAGELPNLTIVVFNNNSGSIFRRLPISKFGEPFEKHFLTAHDLDFSHAAQLYSLVHMRFSDRPAFGAGLSQALNTKQPHLLEIMTDGAEDELARKQLIQRVLG